jgi:hypothetical protein
MKIELFRVSRVRKRHVTPFKYKNMSVTRLHVILPYFFIEVKFCINIWCMYKGLLLCRRKNMKMHFQHYNNIVE